VYRSDVVGSLWSYGYHVSPDQDWRRPQPVTTLHAV
jgi:hypothetical protein